MSNSLTNEQRKLIEENIPLIYKFYNDYKIYNMEKEDYIQLLIEAVCEAIPKYNDDRGKLSTFLYKCMKNRYKTIIKSLNRKHNTLPEGHTFLYLDEYDINFLDLIEDKSEDGYDIMVKHIKEEINKKYGKSYAEIFEMKAMGDTLSEISEKFGMTKQGISVRLNKIKPFIRKQLLEN